MDWGSSFFAFCSLYFFGYIILSVLLDPATYEPVDITKPDIGHRYGGDEDNGFYWAMMMNQGDE